MRSRDGPPLALGIDPATPTSVVAEIARSFVQFLDLTGYRLVDDRKSLERALAIEGVEKAQVSISSNTGCATPACSYLYRRMSPTDLKNDQLCESLHLNPATVNLACSGDFIYLWKIGVAKRLAREIRTNLVKVAVEDTEHKFSLPVIAKVNQANLIILNNCLKMGFEKIGDIWNDSGQSWQWIIKQPTVIEKPAVNGLFPIKEWEKLTALDKSTPVSIVGRRTDFETFMRSPEFALIQGRGNPVIFYEPVAAGIDNSVESLVRVPGMRHQFNHLRVSITNRFPGEVEERFIEAARAWAADPDRDEIYSGGDYGVDALYGPHAAVVLLLPDELRNNQPCLDRDWINCVYSRIGALKQESTLCLFGGNPDINLGAQIDYFLRPLYTQLCRGMNTHQLGHLDPNKAVLALTGQQRLDLVAQQRDLLV